MVKTLDQINQEFYIQWYLAGREAPQAPVWVEPPPMPAAPQPGDVERWMQELLSSPDLDGAEELLDGLPLPDFASPPRRQADKQDTFQFSLPPEQPRAAVPAEQTVPHAPQTPHRKNSNLWKSVSNIFFYAALAAIVLGAAILGSKNSGGTILFGFRYFEVLSRSMQSEIPQGSLVFTQKVPSGEIQVGDVITFLRSDEKYITHTVIAVVSDFDGRGNLGFQTKGTDNPDPDPDIVGAANVAGVVKAHIGGLGFTLRYIADNIKYVFLGFILIILTSIAVRVFLGERRKEQAQQSEEDCGHIPSNRTRKDQQLCKRQTVAV